MYDRYENDNLHPSEGIDDEGVAFGHGALVDDGVHQHLHVGAHVEVRAPGEVQQQMEVR